MPDPDLNLIRLALQTNGWFVVIDYLYQKAEESFGKNDSITRGLNSVAHDIELDIENLGGEVRCIYNC